MGRSHNEVHETRPIFLGKVSWGIGLGTNAGELRFIEAVRDILVHRALLAVANTIQRQFRQTNESLPVEAIGVIPEPLMKDFEGVDPQAVQSLGNINASLFEVLGLHFRVVREQLLEARVVLEDADADLAEASHQRHVGLLLAPRQQPRQLMVGGPDLLQRRSLLRFIGGCGDGCQVLRREASGDLRTKGRTAPPPKRHTVRVDDRVQGHQELPPGQTYGAHYLRAKLALRALAPSCGSSGPCRFVSLPQVWPRAREESMEEAALPGALPGWYGSGSKGAAKIFGLEYPTRSARPMGEGGPCARRETPEADWFHAGARRSRSHSCDRKSCGLNGTRSLPHVLMGFGPSVRGAHRVRSLTSYIPSTHCPHASAHACQEVNMQHMIHIARVIAPFDFQRVVYEQAFEREDHARQWALARRAQADAHLSEDDKAFGFRHSTEYAAMWLVRAEGATEADLT